MKALVNKGDGGMSVELSEVPEPSPNPNEALVEVRAVAVNRGELRLLRARPRGWQPGQDVAGVIIEQASDRSGPPAGVRVVAWPEQSGWAQKVAVPTTHLAHLADHVTFPEAATLPIAGMTALRALRLGGHLAGKRVLVTGAAGGVGRFAVEMAAGAGATVTGVVADEARAIGLEEIGASSITYELDELEGPFDFILDAAGGPSFEAAIRLIAPGGDIVVYGNSSDTPAQVSFSDFRGHALARITAFFVYESGAPPTFGEDLQTLADMVAGGDLHPQIGLEVPWAEANSAFEALANRKVNGKAVLLIE
ncbi:MAG TPA: zinc-binding dehydrogenase [Acidimicrobiia bacterium]|nr:zinc-binding dehydrogenase [Acidimicrobiia bacterium]